MFKYTREKKLKYIKDNEGPLQDPLKFIVSYGIAFGVLMFVALVLGFAVFPGDQEQLSGAWAYIKLFVLYIVLGQGYGVAMFFITRYYTRKYKQELNVE